MRSGYRFYIRPPAVTLDTRLHSLHDFFNRRQSSVDLQMHGLLLVMRKPPEFRPQNFSAKNSCVRFRFLREWELQRYPLTQSFSFLEGPPPGGFSFCYVIGFPSKVVNSEWPASGIGLANGK